MNRPPRTTGKPPMMIDPSAMIARTHPGARFLVASTLACLASAGCHHQKKEDYTSASKPPAVQVIHPEARNIVRVVGQPSFIEAYERTSIYPKVTGYIEKWVVDIGDKVKKGDVLARLFVPELVEDFETKKATVKLDADRVELARKVVDVTDADVKSAEASLDESKAILAKYQAEVDRWESEVKRLSKEVDRGVVDPQILLESTNQSKSATASRDAAKSSIARASADLLSKQAMLAKAKVDVSVAQSALSVASSEARRLEAWNSYLTLAAPFDGIVVVRNANTFDFVKPSIGDPSADMRAPDLSPSGSAAPIYVVDRTDIIRIFVDIPEQDANDVRVGAKASILVKAYRDTPVDGTVTRTAWALNVKSRTLRAEIDLPNAAQRFLPGMYAYAKIIIEHPGTMSLPVTALTHSGDKTYCWIDRDGKSERAEVRTGVSDGQHIEVTTIQPPESGVADPPWNPVNGSEKVLFGDLSILADGGPIRIVTPKAEKGAQDNQADAPKLGQSGGH